MKLSQNAKWSPSSNAGSVVCYFVQLRQVKSFQLWLGSKTFLTRELKTKITFWPKHPLNDKRMRFVKMMHHNLDKRWYFKKFIANSASRNNNLLRVQELPHITVSHLTRRENITSLEFIVCQFPRLAQGWGVHGNSVKRGVVSSFT